jgi:tRNA dimethylallyltransferase
VTHTPETPARDANPNLWRRRAVVLTGPTASGKSAVALVLAELLDAEIIALDSMTLYRGMDIGTAKPSLQDRSRIPHHLIDVLDPWDSASVAQYRAWAVAAAQDVHARGRVPLFVGGTPLYLKALLRGLCDAPQANPEIRARLEEHARAYGDAALHAILHDRDPRTAARLHPHDRKRIVRALEVVELTGQPLSALQRQHDQPAPDIPVFALQLPRPVLHQRINSRSRLMFDMGLVAETRRLLSDPQPLHPIPSQAVAYRECIDHLNGKCTLEQALAQTQTRTRQIAKRQETWFRGLAEVARLPIPPQASPEQIAIQLHAQLHQRNQDRSSRLY